MDGHNMLTRKALKILTIPALAIVAVAVLLSWHGQHRTAAEAAGGGPEMDMSVELADTTTCPGGTPAGTACVMAGNAFTLQINAVGIPGGGYILANTFIDYGPDLIYKEAPDPTTEVVWPDAEPLTVLRATNLAPHTVGHGALTGLLSPPTSTFIGTLVQLEFNCSPGVSSSTEIQLLPSGDPVAGTSGALYVEPPSTQITPKVNNLTVDCVGPTPTPTDTPVPPTATPTVSPTPTNTPTPLPPPSERPDVKVTKVDLVDPVDSEGQIEYGVIVESVGLQTAEDVVVEDTLPPGTVFKKANSAGASCNENAGVVTCDITNPMPPSTTVLIQIIVNAPVGTDSLIDNNVTVTSSNEPFANTGNNKDIEQTMVLAPRSDVTLQKTGDPTFLDGGENVVYTLVAKNLGPDSAQNVQVVDTLPTNATFVSATNPECGAPALGEVTCDLGKLGPNQEAIVEIEMTAPIVTRSTFLKNTAVVSADNEPFQLTGNNLAIENTAVIAPPPDLVVDKTDSQDPVLRLGQFSYQITVDNIGLGDALNVVITDTLPTIFVGPFLIENSATFVSAAGADCAEGPPTVVVCTVDEINVNQQVVITLNVAAPTLLEDTKIVNSVTASSSDPDDNPAGNDATESTLVRACFDTNGDQIVDLPNDIQQTILHAGLTENDPGWDPVYDFDGDGTVGLAFDIQPVILHFGQNCALLL